MTSDTPKELTEPPAKRLKIEETAAWLSARGTLRDSLAIERNRPLDAADVGISCYIDDSKPVLTGILKHRFMDFLVNEVRKDGSTVVLQDMSRPVAVKDSEDSPKPARPRNDKLWPEDADERLSSQLSPEKLLELKTFHSRGPPPKGQRVRHRNDPIPADQRVSLGTFASKEGRKAVHQLIREVFCGSFITEAVEVAATSEIHIFWAVGNDERDRRSHPRPASHLKFIHFNLQKRNRETHDALLAISSALRVHVRELGTTGTKDKRGVTVQRVSLRRGNHTTEDVWKAVNGGGRDSQGLRGARGRGRGGRMGAKGGTPCFDLKVADLSYEAQGLELGEAGGNRFRMVIRDVQAINEDAIIRAVSTLREKGFINYFGMQRFGTAWTGTHVIGLAILQGNFDLAAQLLLRPVSDGPPDAARARQLWSETGDADATLKFMPRNYIAERCLLSYYAKHGVRSPTDAIAAIPKNLRMMYVHAYQSRLWNIVVSERIRLYGAEKAVAGDLISTDGGDAPDEVLLSDAEEAEDVAAVTDSGVTETKSELPETNGQFLGSSMLPCPPAVEHLTDANAHEHSIFDVVFPLAGFLIEYPAGQLGARYRELLTADGLDPDKLFHKQKEYSMAGVYRKIVQRPTNLDFALLHYDDPDQQLSLSDEEILLGRTLPATPKTGKYLALKLDFTLKPSTYATMALREVLKTETASRAQKLLTEEMQARHEKSL